jgi:hypothetical protein
MLMCPETERRQVSLRVFNNEPTARMAEQRLQMAGIPCLIRSLRGGAGLWGTTYNLPHDLLVYEEDQVWASEVLGIVLREQDEDLSSRNPRWKVILASTVIVSLITFVLAVGNQ